MIATVAPSSPGLSLDPAAEGAPDSGLAALFAALVAGIVPPAEAAPQSDKAPDEVSDDTEGDTPDVALVQPAAEAAVLTLPILGAPILHEPLPVPSPPAPAAPPAPAPVMTVSMPVKTLSTPATRTPVRTPGPVTTLPAPMARPSVEGLPMADPAELERSPEAPASPPSTRLALSRPVTTISRDTPEAPTLAVHSAVTPIRIEAAPVAPSPIAQLVAPPPTVQPAVPFVAASAAPATAVVPIAPGLPMPPVPVAPAELTIEPDPAPTLIPPHAPVAALPTATALSPPSETVEAIPLPPGPLPLAAERELPPTPAVQLEQPGPSEPADPRPEAARRDPAAPSLPETAATPAAPPPQFPATAAPEVAAPPAPAPALTDAVVQHRLDLAHDGQWLDQLARDITLSAATDGELRFRLNPEHLGSLAIEVRQTAEGATIRMTADTEAARQIIADAQPRLLAEARAQGLRVADAQVDLGHGQQPRHQHAAPREPLLRALAGDAENAATVTVNKPLAAIRDRYA